SKRLAEVNGMPTFAIYLRPKSSLGALLSSDTIFGAICWAIRFAEGEQVLGQWLNRCQSDNPEWVLSSAFPFVDSDKPLHFLPKPLTLNPDAETVATVAGDDRKRLLMAMGKARAIRKCAYISETLFATTVKGELKAKVLLEKVLSGEVEIKGGCILNKLEAELLPKRFLKTADIQHTAIDRLLASAAEGLLYFDTEHFFGKRIGLFFLLRCPDDFPIDSVLRFWEHDGLGGNRSVGKGHFEIEKQPADDWLAQLQPTDGNTVVLLSHCIPKGGEFDLDNSVYRLINKRPKFESEFEQPHRVYKGIIRFIAEGSVLVPKQGKRVFGQLVKVGEQTDFDGVSHPVYQNGLGFVLKAVIG
ncbi:MAG: type III-A CRISPR-associated RAMP protein Csm4, partial [Armatimonadota bacterium]